MNKKLSTRPHGGVGCERAGGPAENGSVELGLYRLQQLRVEEVLTDAKGTPVTGAHAA